MSEPPIVPDPDPGPVVTGWNDSPVTGDRIDVNENSFVAGDPAGARIEIRSTGFHAFNGAGIETAHIDGAEGVFVGGEFRTSDQLPGQVTLSDTGFEDPLQSGIPGPGVGVTPRNPDGFTRFPGVGPSWGGMTISGGRDDTGRWGTIEASPASSTLRAIHEGGGAGYISTAVGESRILTSGPDGESGEVSSTPTSSRLRTRAVGGDVASEVNASSTSVTARTYGGNGESGWLRTRPGDVEIAYVDSLNTYFSRLRATDAEASLFTRAGGMNRDLTVDADGIWVRSGDEEYNLLDAARDSGWQSITPDAGYTGSASFAWRNKGGVIWYRGTVTATWATGWNTIATLPAEVHPAYGYTVNEAGTSAGVLIRIQVDGRLQLYAPAAGTSTHRFTSLSYPIG